VPAADVHRKSFRLEFEGEILGVEQGGEQQAQNCILIAIFGIDTSR